MELHGDWRLNFCLSLFQLNDKLKELAEEDERIRQEILARDRAAQRLATENQRVISKSDAKLRNVRSKSPFKSPRRSSPLRNSTNYAPQHQQS